ncbi:MAG: GNAT family N-acetyltransferase [Chitinophagales bacterium]|nr:GNAT family N-acetyltransferase [Chitinophagales bacterium]
MTKEIDLVHIRIATKQDLPAVYQLIKELAIYENEPHEPTNSLKDFVADGSGEEPRYRVIIAEKEHEIIGIALYYLGYSTWKGNMVYLDDLIVKEAYRRNGIGELLFKALIAATCEHGANQLRWHVLNWNEPAIEFYKKINATFDNQWLTCKIEKDKLYLL